MAHSSGGLPSPSTTRSATAPIDRSVGTFLDFEIPQTHPLDLNPGASLLAVCNTADARVELFDVALANGRLSRRSSIPVGYSPVSARFRTANELWIVNHVSDSISVVDCN